MKISQAKPLGLAVEGRRVPPARKKQVRPTPKSVRGLVFGCVVGVVVNKLDTLPPRDEIEKMRETKGLG
jgi:hypothetical protein